MSDITEIVEQVIVNEIVEQVIVNEGGTYNFASPKPDWNALEGEDNEILNRPNLGTAAFANIEDFASPKPDWNALEGDDAEILNRPNLGTAAFANVEDFATPKPDWNALEGDDAEILNKPNLGTAALASIEDFATAAQGSKADNSVQLTGNQSIAGTKTFTSPLILPNNSRINDIEHFYQTTKPTTRGDGSALVIGDIWYKTNNGTQWFWNGTYWLNANREFIHTPSGFSTGNNLNYSYVFSKTNAGQATPVFVESLTYVIFGATTLNAGMQIEIRLVNQNESNGSGAAVRVFINGTGIVPLAGTTTVGTLLNTGTNVLLFTSLLAVTGNPTIANWRAKWTLREVFL